MRGVAYDSGHQSALASRPHHGLRRQFAGVHLMESGPDLLAGTVVKDRYLLLERLGSGGEGKVYLASDKAEGRIVALKLIGKLDAPPEAGDGLLDLSGHFRLTRELRAFAAVAHPNVVKLLDSGLHNGVPFLVMERLSGADLHKEIRLRGPMGWEAAKPLILQMCDAVGALHSKGIMHRDIKPSNIFLCDGPGGPSVKLIDLDLVKFVGPTQGRDAEDSDEVVGTPAYMAPEMLDGTARCDTRLDIYSLGATIYEMLAGVPPYSPRSYLELMMLHRERLPRPVNDVRPGACVPDAVQRILSRALEHDPERRYQSVAELRADLEAVMAGEPPEPPRREGPLIRAWRLLKDLAGIICMKTDFLGGLDLMPWDADPLGR